MKIKEGYTVQEVAGTGVVLSLKEMDCGHVMTVNGSGLDMWKLLEKETTVAKLVEDMMALYDVDEPTLRRDIERFLDQLRKADLLDEQENA